MNAGARPYVPQLPPLDYGVGNMARDARASLTGWHPDPVQDGEMFTSLPVFAEGEVTKIYDLQRRDRHVEALALCDRCPVHYDSLTDDTRRNIVSARTCFATLHCLEMMGPRLVHSGRMHIYEDAALRSGFLWKLASRMTPLRTAHMKERCPLTRALAAALHVPSPTAPDMWMVARSVHMSGRTTDSRMPVDPAHVLIDPVEPLAVPAAAAHTDADMDAGNADSARTDGGADGAATCNICHERVIPGTRAGQQPSDTACHTRCCKNLYHLGCLAAWSNEKGVHTVTCPLCREKLVRN